MNHNFFTKWFQVLATAVIIHLFVSGTGCSKEYSCESCNINSPADSLPIPATPPVSSELPVCPSCNSYPDPVELNQWSLKAQQSQACGIIDTAIINPERTAFTFYGPSACSADTGMVLTVYMENRVLNQDISNLTINRSSFYFYDRVTPSDIYMSRQTVAFPIHIDRYDHQTKIMTGSFSGTVFRGNGSPASISNGKFKVKLI